jgi:hypothetical protein
MILNYAELLSGDDAVVNHPEVQKGLIDAGFVYENNKDDDECFHLEINKKYIWHIRIYKNQIKLTTMNKNSFYPVDRYYGYTYNNIESFNYQFLDVAKYINQDETTGIILSEHIKK